MLEFFKEKISTLTTLLVHFLGSTEEKEEEEERK